MTGILCSLPMIGAPTGSSSGVPAMSVALNRSSVSASGTSAALTTNSAKATPTGGTAPYSYAWSRSSGDSSITASSPSSATSSFQRSGCVVGSTYTGNWKCTVTDSVGNTATSGNESVSITRTTSGGGGGGGGSTLAASTDTGSATGSGSTSVISTGSVTASATGGTAPYTYQWVQVSSDSNFSAVSAGSATTVFRRAGCAASTTYDSDWKCTVTDSVGATADTPSVLAEVTRS